MYLRTLLYALRQGVALDGSDHAPASSALIPGSQPGMDVADTAGMLPMEADTDTCAGSVPDRLLDMYLSTKDSISLTSKVLDVYATYVDEGEVCFKTSR